MLQNGESLVWALPETPGVYMWKLSLQVPYHMQADPESFAAWLDRLCRVPSGAYGEKRLGHSLLLKGLELRGAGLPAEKLNVFLGFLGARSRRKWMTQFLQELSGSLPALYVGETDNIATRATQHMTGQSDFGGLIQETEELEWADLELHYLKIGTGAAEQRQVPFRQSIEYLCATLTVAGYTRRPG